MIFENMTLDELRKLKADLAQEEAKRLAAAAVIERELRAKYNAQIFKHKAALIELLEHDRLGRHGENECTDADPYNGFLGSDGQAHCNKCALICLEEWNLDELEITLKLEARKP